MKYKFWRVLSAVLIASLLALAGCDDGKNGDPGAAGATGPVGAAGPAGADVDPATVDDLQTQIDALGLADIEPESCAVCHSGAGEGNHQNIYNDYNDASDLTLSIDSVASVSNGDTPETFTITVTASVALNGAPVLDFDEFEQYRFGWATYDSATRKFVAGEYIRDNITPTGTPGEFTLEDVDAKLAIELTNGQVYGYVADGLLDTESGGHVHMYNDVASDGVNFGDANTYASAANVSGCEKCHGAPYMKHGYRDPVVANLGDFGSCKICHVDTKSGGHEDWQLLVDNPARFVEVHDGDDLTAVEEVQYAYKRSIMNDVHMSHAMEFPYPQSMANCTTCHEGKMDITTTDANFTAETCKSCHPVTGPAEGTDSHRAPAIETLWADLGVEGFHDISQDCNVCHQVGGIGPEFKTLHTGYDKHIYADATGTRYSELFTVSVDDASLTGDILNVKFSATKNGAQSALVAADIIPTVMIGLYGYDTKDFLVSPHGRDADRNRYLEFQIDGNTTNPRLEVISAAGGSWEINADLTMWADLLADGTVERAEIGIMPLLANVIGEIDSHSNGESDDTNYALIAPSRTFDLGANAFDDTFFADIVDVENGCNTCHDALATTFHSPNRSGNIRICRLCHVPTSGGGHLEMQSRSIDSYVHAVHSFQAFDTDDIDFTDPVEKTLYGIHIEHTYPNFTIKNCESCHLPGTYEVPDQSKSLPGIMSASYDVGFDRNISVPSYVAGPASRACGSCHRSHLINENDGGKLVAFNQHTKSGGYLEENATGVFDTIVMKIMSMFQ